MISRREVWNNRWLEQFMGHNKVTEKISADSRTSLNDYFIFKKKDCSGHTENRENDKALET